MLEKGYNNWDQILGVSEHDEIPLERLILRFFQIVLLLHPVACLIKVQQPYVHMACYPIHPLSIPL